MGKKHGKASGSGKKPADVKSAKPAQPTAGPSRVFLLRHGESEANASRTDVRDAFLTALGRVQASAWKGSIGKFGAECVLLSPLRRAIETALLAFDGVPDVPLEVCRHARELWWDELANTLSPPETIYKLLSTLPRGDEVCGVEQALAETADCPQSESESIQAMKQALAARSEACVAVVCHWGVINSLCGEGADNCTLVECRRNANGKLIVEKCHDPPRAPRTR